MVDDKFHQLEVYFVQNMNAHLVDDWADHRANRAQASSSYFKRRCISGVNAVLRSRTSIGMDVINLVWINHIKSVRLENVQEARESLSLVCRDGHYPGNLFELLDRAPLLLYLHFTIDREIKYFDEHLLCHVLNHESVLFAAYLRQDIEDQARNVLQDDELVHQLLLVVPLQLLLQLVLGSLRYLILHLVALGAWVDVVLGLLLCSY